MTFLKINNLSVDYKMRRETVYAAKNVNIEVSKGEILGLVGESGSGKSTVGNAIINLIDEPGKVSNGSVLLGDINVHEDPENIVKYRGKKIAGKKVIHHSPENKKSLPSLINVPKEGVVGGTPTPKKLSVASAIIASASPIVPITRTGLIIFGKICLNIIIKFETPIIVEAET